MVVILIVSSKKLVERNTLIFKEKAKNVQAWTLRRRGDFTYAGTNGLRNKVSLNRDPKPTQKDMS